MLTPKNNAVLIVGHGPELFDKKKGKIVDAFGTVIRMGDACKWQDERNYGIKTDYYILPTTQLHYTNTPQFKKYKPSKRLWISHNMGDDPNYPPLVGKYKDEIMDKYAEYKPDTLFGIIVYWHNVFQRYLPKKQKFSTGMLAIINTVHRLRPTMIILPAFDNLRKGTHDNYRCGIDKSGKHFKAEGHDLVAENKLLKDLQQVYGFGII